MGVNLDYNSWSKSKAKVTQAATSTPEPMSLADIEPMTVSDTGIEPMEVPELSDITIEPMEVPALDAAAPTLSVIVEPTAESSTSSSNANQAMFDGLSEMTEI